MQFQQRPELLSTTPGYPRTGTWPAWVGYAEVMLLPQIVSPFFTSFLPFSLWYHLVVLSAGLKLAETRYLVEQACQTLDTVQLTWYQEIQETSLVFHLVINLLYAKFLNPCPNNSAHTEICVRGCIWSMTCSDRVYGLYDPCHAICTIYGKDATTLAWAIKVVITLLQSECWFYRNWITTVHAMSPSSSLAISEIVLAAS